MGEQSPQNVYSVQTPGAPSGACTLELPECFIMSFPLGCPEQRRELTSSLSHILVMTLNFPESPFPYL